MESIIGGVRFDQPFDHVGSLVHFAVDFCVFGGLMLFFAYKMISCCMISVTWANKKTATTTTASKVNTATIVCLVAYVLSPLIATTENQTGLHDLIKGTDPLLDDIIKRIPSMTDGPSPPFLLRNRHAQFLPWLIQNELHREGIPFQRIYIEVTACIDNSEGPDVCTPSSMMNDTISLDIFPPLNNVDSIFNENFNDSSPIIMFMPGLRCYSQDMPGNMIIRHAYGNGFRSIVVNRRGHTPNQKLKAPRWNLFGDVYDIEQVYWYIKHNLASANTPLFLHGISSGTSVTVTALATWDKRRARHPTKPSPSFVASISVTPGYDISKVLRPDRFKEPYNSLLTPLVKQHFVLQNEEILREFDNEAVDKALEATTLQEFVDASVPFAGYKNVTEYYKYENPVNEMTYISTPKLVLNSIDDPCCHIQNLYEQSPYEDHENQTFAQQIKGTERGLVLVTKSGSHCPFLSSVKGQYLPVVRDPLFGGWMLNSWADQVSIEYYKAALDVYGSRRFL